MARPMMSCIQRTCPDCGTLNKIVTPEVRPSWRINCSSCGCMLFERRGFRPRLVEPVARDIEAAAPLLKPVTRDLDLLRKAI